MPQVVRPPLREDGSHIYFYYSIQVEQRDRLARFMTERLRDVQISHHRNCASLPCFSAYHRECPNAEKASQRVVYLPTYPGYRNDQVARQCREHPRLRAGIECMDVAVIGSGVSGTFTAHALAGRGASVTILDVGETLDARRQAAVDRLHDVPPEDWPAADFRLIDENPTYGKGVLPKKVHFGSDYIYAEDRSFAHIDTKASGRVPYPTFAKGGFSNIWGAAVLPTDACDMADWPISRAQMEPYFRKVAQLIPICGGEGNLERHFPAYAEALGWLDAGPQGDALLADLKRAEKSLLERQTIFGKARLAVHTRDGDHGVLACNGCGYCFTGCVRNAIYSTLPMLIDLVGKGVQYRLGLFVEQIAEQDGKAILDVIDLRSHERSSLTFDAVFVAGGPINTTRLLLRSRRLYDQASSAQRKPEVRVADAAYARRADRDRASVDHACLGVSRDQDRSAIGSLDPCANRADERHDRADRGFARNRPPSRRTALEALAAAYDGGVVRHAFRPFFRR